MKLIAKLNIVPIILALFLGLYYFSSLFVQNPLFSGSGLGLSLAIDERSENVYKDYQYTELLKGEKITGRFESRLNNLGIILIPFYNSERINSDSVIFKFKNAGASKWLYEQEYKTNQFQPNKYFTFGIPTIKDSKGSSYEFEIESVNGTVGDAIRLSSTPLYFATAHQYSQSYILQSYTNFTDFIFTKSLFVIKRIDYGNVLKVYLVSIAVILVIHFERQIKSEVTDIRIKIKRRTHKLRKVERIFRKIITFIYKIVKEFYFKLDGFLRFMHSKAMVGSAQVIIISGFIILSVALLFRVTYYLNPNNTGTFAYSKFGGSGDYDLMLRHAWRFNVNHDIQTLYWSYVDDYVLVGRIQSYFFKTFGFIDGLDYMTYFFIVTGSLICLMPFLLLSSFRKYSFGGLIASIFLTVNPLLTGLPSKVHVDTFTNFIFAVFISLFVFALNKKSYILGISLGFAGFADSLNRGLMLLNDLPALVLFGFYYLLVICKPPSLDIRSHIMELSKIPKSEIFYAIIPLITFLMLYASWNLYYFSLFNFAWNFSPTQLISRWNPFNDPEKILGNTTDHKILTYIVLFYLALNEIPKHMFGTAFMPLITAYIGFLSFKYGFLKKHYKYLLTPVLLVGLFYLMQLIIRNGHIIDPTLDKTAFRYFLDITGISFFNSAAFFLLCVIQIYLLKKEFIKYFIIIVTYLFILGYGLFITFSERHYSQVLLVSFLIFGASLDAIFSSKPKSNAQHMKYFIGAYLIILTVSFSSVFLNKATEFVNYLNYWNKEQVYLNYASSLIPENGIILLGIGNENIVNVSRHTKKTIVYNVSNPEPLIIPYTNEYFHLPFISVRDSPDIKISYVKDELKTDFSMNTLIKNKTTFNNSSFYVLDYNIDEWERIISEKVTGYHFSSKDVYELVRINKNDNRGVYRLVVKEGGHKDD